MIAPYPKTYHIDGSKGRGGMTYRSLNRLEGDTIFVEEKLDGTCVAVDFHPEIEGMLRYHDSSAEPLSTTLPGIGPLKQWGYEHFLELKERLGTRYVLWGEWLYLKHTVYYDQVPSPFMVFDLYDKQEGLWFSTPRRHEMLSGTSFESVPVLFEGEATKANLDALMGQQSRFKSKQWQEHMQQTAKSTGVDYETLLGQTDVSDCGEGLYVKGETALETVGWYKYVRADFVNTIVESESHWRNRRPVRNGML